jgi:hypothetical protein
MLSKVNPYTAILDSADSPISNLGFAEFQGVPVNLC